MKIIEEEIEVLNQQQNARIAWIDRTTKTVWKLIVVLVGLVIIANVLNWYC